MRAKQRRRMEAKAAALVEADVHEVNVDDKPKPEETIQSLKAKVKSLEGVLKGEHAQVNKLRQEVADTKEAAAVDIHYAKEACAKEIAELKKANEDTFVNLHGDLEGQLQVARTALAEIVSETQDRLVLGTGAIFEAVVEAIALRVQTLPNGPWSTKNIADKIRKNSFEHPVGVRDYYPVLGENGFPVLIDGNEVELPEHIAFKEQAKVIINEAKTACRELHRMELNRDRPPVTIVLGQPWYLTGYRWSK